MNIHGKDIKIFSCNSNRAVAEEVAAILGLKLGDMTVKSFADGEVSVTIEESVRGSDVFVIQSTCRPVNKKVIQSPASVNCAAAR